MYAYIILAGGAAICIAFLYMTWRKGFASEKSLFSKAALDNRSRQLNSKDIVYWLSRGYKGKP